MSAIDKLYILALANLLICAGTAKVCLCRLGKTGPDTKPRFIVLYGLMLVGAVASALQPVFFGEWPGSAEVFVNATLLAFLASGSKAWRERQPSYALKPRPLDAEDLPHVIGGSKPPQAP